MKKSKIVYYFSILVYFLGITLIYSQTNVYFLPGQGADERLFGKITLDSQFSKRYIAYPIPKKGENMANFAQSLVNQIDTTKPFVLIGTSLGGMLSVELAEIIKPKQVIIISSAKNNQELPFQYRFQRKIPLNRLVPKSMVKWSAQRLQPIVEPDRNKQKAIFKSMLSAKNKTYMKRSVDLITHWNRTTYDAKIIHIHGDNDHTLPLKNIKANYIIKGGSHMMTLTRGEELNSLILSLLEKTSPKN